MKLVFLFAGMMGEKGNCECIEAMRLAHTSYMQCQCLR